MKNLYKYVLISLLTLNLHAIAEEDKFDDLVHYTDSINNEFLDIDKNKSIEIITYFDTLIAKMYGYEEVEVLKQLKQKFIEKYIERAFYIDEANKNLRTIINNRRNRQIIEYEEEINNKKILLK